MAKRKRTKGQTTIYKRPINARGIPNLINILQGIPTDHEGGSYIHVPYITERRPYMSTHPFFAGHTGHEFAEMYHLR
jgi:hypothetical protein